jgi:hypothetical protein
MTQVIIGGLIASTPFTTDSHAAKGGAIENENGYTGNYYP